MDKVSVKLNVFFEGTFWVGIFEKVAEGKLSVCKVTFGAEPKDHEVNEFLLENYFKLRFSSSVEAEVKKVHNNPKRIQREVHKQIENFSVGTKSQQALKLQHEQIKTTRKQVNRKRKEEEKQLKFQIKQQKRKEKHKGR